MTKRTKNLDPLTLDYVFRHPETVTSRVALANGKRFVLRPLQGGDVELLARFLEGLSPTTRAFSTFDSYDRTAAQALCDAINRYDKLRFVVEDVGAENAVGESGAIVGLMEFSFGIPEGDVQRYQRYGMVLDGRVDCRFGPTLADGYQDRGLGSALFPHLVDVARRFGKQRIVLWGGVFAANMRAIRFYEKQGFVRAGAFAGANGQEVIDMLLTFAQ